MKDNKMIEKAISMAIINHRDQTDKAGKLYVLHPLRIMSKFNTPIEQIVAVLHDIIEDTDVTFKDLEREKIPDEAIDAIECLTRREGESYRRFISRIRMNKIAIEIKIEDIKDNMDLSRLEYPTEKDIQRFQKYKGALEILKRR